MVGVRILFLFPFGFRPYFHGRNVAVRFRLQPTTLKFRRWLAGKPTMNEDVTVSPNEKMVDFPAIVMLRQLQVDRFWAQFSMTTSLKGPQVLVATFLVSGTSGSFLKFQGNIQKFDCRKFVWSWKNAGNGRQFSFLHLHPCSLTWTENQKKWCSSFSGFSFHLLFKAKFWGEPCLLALPKTNEFPLRIGRNPKGNFVFRDTKISPSVQNIVRKAYHTWFFAGSSWQRFVFHYHSFCFETSAIPRVFAFNKKNWKHLSLEVGSRMECRAWGEACIFSGPLCKHKEKQLVGGGLFRHFFIFTPQPWGHAPIWLIIFFF